MNLTNEKDILFDLTLKTMKLAEQIRLSLKDQDIIKKIDLSPVTIADYSCQALINYSLHQYFPNDYLMGEEDSSYLFENHILVDKILENVQSFLPHIQRKELLDVVDLGNYSGGFGRYWAIDPIDGTKAFVRNEPYAIAICLIDKGNLLVSSLGCPLGITLNSTPSPHLYFAVKGQGASSYSLYDQNTLPLKVTQNVGKSDLIYCEAHSSTQHHSHHFSKLVIQEVNSNHHSLPLDSQCKYALVASAKADVYIRFPKEKARTIEDKENIWDHGPGHLIVEEAGGQVSDILGKPLDYTQGKVFKNNEGILASNGKLHEALVNASQQIYRKRV